METGNELKSSESQPTAYQMIFLNTSFILYQTQTTEDIRGFLQTVC